MGLFGKKKCGHESSSPFRATCTRSSGHTGRHSARGMRWGSDGRILFTAKKAGGK
jgi:hypothetical protein